MSRTENWSFQEKFQYRMSILNPKLAFEMHQLIYRLTGGRLGGTMRGIPVLLLTTTGRRSGKQRTRPLMYLQDERNYVIVASNAGQNKPPAWWFNLRANPSAHIQVGSRKLPVTAEIATPEEHDRLWPRICNLNPFYAAYQERTQRTIDLIILRPEAGSDDLPG
jgi:F420H(2)-dependent quinone reductase